MELLNQFETTINSIKKKIMPNPKINIFIGIIIYSLLFIIISIITISPTISNTDQLLGGDGTAQYLPLLYDFKRNMTEFFKGISHGNFDFKMVNFNYMFGSDSFLTSFIYFLPFLPVYICVVFVSEESVPLFFAFAVILISYFCGITFIYMCHHFKVNDMWSGLFAVAYIFCGNYFSSGILNPQFLCMYFVFPILIIGIDNIINDKSGVLFSIGISFLASGFTYLFYTVPFIILFAMLRVYFVKKQKYIKNLVKYFIKGFGYSILGIAIACFSMLPYLYFLFNSNRGTFDFPSLSTLLTPSFNNLTDTFYANRINANTQVCASVIPFLIYVICSFNAKKEHKIYLLISLGLISMPLISYGINGFQYDICRWGFVTSCFFCFIASYYAPVLFNENKKNLAIYLICMIVYLLTSFINIKLIGLLIIIAIGLISAFFAESKRSEIIPDKVCSGFHRFCMFYKRTSSSPIKYKRYFLLAITSLIVLGVILGITAVIISDCYSIAASYIIISIWMIAAIFIFKRKNLSYSLKLFTVIIILISTITYYNNHKAFTDSASKKVPDQKDEIISCIDYHQNYFNRFSDITTESKYRVLKSYSDALDEGEEGTLSSMPSKSSNDDDSTYKYPFSETNLSLRYNVASSEMFFSVIDSDYINFLVRCGVDKTIFPNSVCIRNFYGQEAIYSLFGINNMMSDGELEDDLFGISRNYNISDDILSVYYNNYALPIGVTYDTYSDKETFESFGPAELPYAMMNSVYLEGNSDKISNSQKQYSKICDYENKQELRGVNSNDFSSYDNTMTINDDVSNGFLFLQFTGVRYKIINSFNSVFMKVGIDNNKTYTFSIGNELSPWPWKYDTYTYSLPLGYHKQTVKQLKFITPFDYENMELIFIPSENYTDAYNNRCSEILENVKLSTNTIAGSINVSSDKVLCINMIHNDGWSAYVDGEKTAVYKANDLFLGIRLKAGSHEVKFKYRTPWLYEGAIISLISTILAVIISFKNKHRNK